MVGDFAQDVCLICGHQEGGATSPWHHFASKPVKEARSAPPNNYPTVKELRGHATPARVKRMKRRTCLLVCLGAIFASSLHPAQAGKDECNEAVDRYDSAISEIESTLRRYSNSVSGSQGNDDCYSEFRRLESAQDDFESAVSIHQSECS